MTNELTSISVQRANISKAKKEANWDEKQLKVGLVLLP